MRGRYNVDRQKYMSIDEAATALGKSRDWVEIRAKQGLFANSIQYGRRAIFLTRKSVEEMKRQL